MPNPNSYFTPTPTLTRRDCLHYCLPGPSDAWALALYNLLLNNPRYEREG